MKKHVTISLDEKLYNEYVKFCKYNGFMMSERLRRYIRTDIKNWKDQLYKKKDGI